MGWAQHRPARRRARPWLRRLRHVRRHPPSASLSRYLDNDLAPADREAIERHVRECGPCRRMLWSLSETVRVLGTLRVRDSSGDAERMLAALAPRLNLSDDPGDERPGNERRTQLRAALRFTVPIGLVVGAALSLANKGAMLLEGQIDLGMCAVCALDFLLPFAAMNVALLAVTRLVSRS